MSLVEQFVCDVCGIRARDQSTWFVLCGEGANLEVRRWDDNLAGQPATAHACCAEHLEKLVFNSVAPGLRNALTILSVRHGGWNPAALQQTAASSNDSADSLLSLLNAIDGVLQGPTRDEEESVGFDA